MWKSFSEAIKQDLATFVTTIQEDTTKTLTKVVGLEEDDPKDEELSLREKLIADTKRSFSTYGTPVEEAHEVQYERFFRTFSLASHGKEIAELLDAEIDVSRYYAELVPAQITAEDFWARYFFRLALVAKGGVLSLDEDDDEEELVWESEEQEDACGAAAADAGGKGGRAAGAASGAAGAAAAAGAASSSTSSSTSTSGSGTGHAGGSKSNGSAEARVLRSKVGLIYTYLGPYLISYLTIPLCCAPRWGRWRTRTSGCGGRSRRWRDASRSSNGCCWAAATAAAAPGAGAGAAAAAPSSAAPPSAPTAAGAPGARKTSPPRRPRRPPRPARARRRPRPRRRGP